MTPDANELIQRLEIDGIAPLPALLSVERLRGMQTAFESRLRRLRWNDHDGFEKTEKYRHMVQDVLALDQGFVDLGLHPLVKQTLDAFIGATFALVEAKGWRSLPTKKDFHGWHGDAWYDQSKVSGIPREVKLAVYLTDVSSGEFHYLKGSHGRQAPRSVPADEVRDVPDDRVARMRGPAGTAFLFDTSGIHRQSYPILERRHAVFLNYHDPSVPLQAEDVEYYRYHPLILNAAFLGGLSAEDQRILGFGNQTNYLPGFERAEKHTGLQSAMHRAYDAKLGYDDFSGRVAAKLAKMFGRRAGKAVETVN